MEHLTERYSKHSKLIDQIVLFSLLGLEIIILYILK